MSTTEGAPRGVKRSRSEPSRLGKRGKQISLWPRSDTLNLSSVEASGRSHHVGPYHRPVRRLSPLESLPTEVLEVIFISTLTGSVDRNSLSLPRASLSLGRQLFSDFVQKKVFIHICSDSYREGVSDPEVVRARSFTSKLHPSPMELSTEHIKAQSWILRQLWVTFDFISRCRLEFMVSTLVREMERRRLHAIDRNRPADSAKIKSRLCEAVKTMETSQQPFSPFIDGRKTTLWYETFPNSLKKRVHLNLDYTQGRIRLSVFEYGDKEFIPERDEEWRIISLRQKTQIPSRVLHGPWTESKVRLLSTFIMGNASVDWVHTTAGETAEQGLRDAIMENNHEAIRALGAVGASDCDSNAPRGVGVLIGQSHLLLAIENGCNTDCVEALLDCKYSECNLQDVRVSQGISDLKAKGWPDRAEWLLRKQQDDHIDRMSQRYPIPADYLPPGGALTRGVGG